MTASPTRPTLTRPGPVAIPPSNRRDERGVVAGADGMAFGLIVLVAGALLIVNAWAMIEHHVALDAAAREYLRAYTEAPDPTTAAIEGTAAARVVLAERGTPLSTLRIDAPDGSRFGPCAPVAVTLTARVAMIRLPFLEDLTPTDVSVRRRELVDPHREILAGPDHDPEDTPCGA